MSNEELLPVNPPLSDVQAIRNRYFGEVASLMSLLPRHRDRSIAVLSRNFISAFRHGQSRVFYNALSEPVAFIVWALVSDETHARILRTGIVELHLSEWNEGANLWILEFGCQSQMLPLVLSECGEMFSDFSECVVPKEYAGRRVLRLLSKEGLEVLTEKLGARTQR